MHPSLIFLLWLFAVLLAQVVPALPLALLASTVLLTVSAPVRRHFAALLWRSRWILLTLLATFVLLTPGERLLAGVWLTREGLQHGDEQLLRLLSVLLAVSWLVGGRPVEWLLAALAGCLSLAGRQAGQRFIVRLALTLRYAAGDERRSSWRALLSASIADRSGGHDLKTVPLLHPPPAAGEKAAAALLLVAMAATLYWLR